MLCHSFTLSLRLRRFAAALLFFTLLCATALADDRPPLRYAGGMYENGYWKEHGIQITAPNYHWVTGVALLQQTNAPDLYSTCTDAVDFAAMKSAGVLADLSGSAILRETVGRMRPEVQALVTDDDGRILALPLGALSNPVYWRQEAFDALGLTTPPQSYTELLDFAEAWAQRVQEHPEKEICFTNTFFFGQNASYNYTFWLLDFLLDAWEMQCYEAGEPVNFDTPEFIALLKRTKEAGKLLHAAEPSYAKCSNMTPLFYNQHGSASFGGYFNGGREEGLSHTVPFRITAEQPVLMRANMDVWVARADSPYIAEITGYLEEVACAYLGGGVYTVELFREGVAPGDHNGEPITAGWIKDRNEYAGKICFAPKRAKDMYEGTMIKFLQGKISAKAFAAAISRSKTDPNK